METAPLLLCGFRIGDTAMNRRERRRTARKDRRRINRPGPDRRSGSDRRAAGGRESLRDDIGRAIEHHQNGEFEKAAAYYRRFLDHVPDNARVLQLLGDVLYQTGEIDAAVEYLQRAIALDPANALAHNNLGNALRDCGRLDEAAGCYRQAIAAKADFAIASNNLGNLQRDRDALIEAEDCYRHALCIDPGLAVVHYNLANVLHDQDRTDDARACYESAIALEPNYPLAHNNLGNLLRGKGLTDAAVACYRHAAAADPGFALGHYNLANILKDQGFREQALDAYRTVLKLAPDHAYAAHMVAALSGETTDIAPRAFVQEVFDSYAHRFEDHLEGALEYRVPEMMRNAVDRAAAGNGAAQNSGFRHALDLGCGTGLVAKHFHDRVERFHGVDLSPKMLEEARRKDLYDELDEADILEFLANGRSRATDYDLALAGDVFIYVGDLDPVFAGLQRCLAPDGLFAFSIERCEAAPYELRTSGRYAQSADYIHRLAPLHGFTVEIEEPITIRKEQDAAVEGALFVLSRNAA